MVRSDFSCVPRIKHLNYQTVSLLRNNSLSDTAKRLPVIHTAMNSLAVAPQN